MIERNKMTMAQAMEIQAAHMRRWKAILHPDIYGVLEGQVREKNAKGYKSPYDVCRGADIDCLVHNLQTQALDMSEDEVVKAIIEDDALADAVGAVLVQELMLRRAKEGADRFQLDGGSFTNQGVARRVLGIIRRGAQQYRRDGFLRLND